jgi:hypothetical protein
LLLRTCAHVGAEFSLHTSANSGFSVLLQIGNAAKSLFSNAFRIDGERKG